MTSETAPSPGLGRPQGTERDPQATKDPDVIVGPREIADRLGVRPNTVIQWKQRGLLPAPFAVISMVPLWHWGDIERWAVRTGRA